MWCRYNLTRFHVLDIFSSAFSSVGLSMSSSDPTFLGATRICHYKYYLLKKKLARFQSKMSRICMILTKIWWKPFTLCQPESQKNDHDFIDLTFFSCPDRTEKEILFDMKVLSKLNRKEMTANTREWKQLQPASEHEAAPIQSPRHYFIGHRSIWTSVCFTTLKFLGWYTNHIWNYFWTNCNIINST